eukprot:scaffold55_cov237-Pinguiococcus_pyrenoidosus.AAC.5
MSAQEAVAAVGIRQQVSPEDAHHSAKQPGALLRQDVLCREAVGFREGLACRGIADLDGLVPVVLENRRRDAKRSRGSHGAQTREANEVQQRVLHVSRVAGDSLVARAAARFHSRRQFHQEYPRIGGEALVAEERPTVHAQRVCHRVHALFPERLLFQELAHRELGRQERHTSDPRVR